MCVSCFFGESFVRVHYSAPVCVRPLLKTERVAVPWKLPIFNMNECLCFSFLQLGLIGHRWRHNNHNRSQPKIILVCTHCRLCFCSGLELTFTQTHQPSQNKCFSELCIHFFEHIQLPRPTHCLWLAKYAPLDSANYFKHTLKIQ